MSDEEGDVVSEALVGEEAAAKERLDLAVDVADAGPCRKRIKISVPRNDIDRFLDKEFSDLVKSAQVPGFRPGKTPRKLIERKYQREVASQVKSNLVLRSLEQVGEEQKIEPLSEPKIDFEAIELPDAGDFVYEFEVEVRPDFELPNYKGLKVRRPVKEISDEEVEKGLKAFLRRFAVRAPKDGGASEGDLIRADIRMMDGDKVLNEFEDMELRVQKDLFFRDGRIAGFAQGMQGAKVGDSRTLKATLSGSMQNESLRNKSIDVVLVVRGVESETLPELTPELLKTVDVGDEGELRDEIRAQLVRNFESKQLAGMRDDLVSQLLGLASFDLPQDLLRRQSERLLRKRLVEFQELGMGEEEVRARLNVLRQNAVEEASRDLRQQFVLQRVAEEEKIEVNDDDIEDGIRAIAMMSGESVRRVRARVQKENLTEAIALTALERKTIQRVLESSELVDVPFKDEEEFQSAGMDASAVSEAEAETAEGEPKAESVAGE